MSVETWEDNLEEAYDDHGFTEVVQMANYIGQCLAPRRADPAPILDADPSRESVIEWLEWSRPNGVWSDAAATAEGWPRMTSQDARDQLWILIYGDFT